MTAKYVGKNKFDYLVEVESEPVLRQMSPDFARLKNVAVRGTIVTARSSDLRFDFVSRFFAPAVGINEDPVTGSAHCCLGDFWHKRLGKNDLRSVSSIRSRRNHSSPRAGRACVSRRQSSNDCCGRVKGRMRDRRVKL